MSGFVYFIGPTSWSVSRVKIGYTSSSVHSRLAGLQTGSPFPLEIYGYVEGDRKLEATFHEAFSPLHVRGEWFDLDAKLLDLVGELAGTTGGRRPYPRDRLWDFVYEVLDSDEVPDHWQDLGHAWIDSVNMGALASYDVDRAWAAHCRSRCQ